MEEHWRDVVEDTEDYKKIHALRQWLYTIEKEELIKREFLLSVLHPKGGSIISTCVKDNKIE